MNNFFVAFEGKEKVGKTTIAKEVCRLTGFKYLKFPNEQNEIGKIIRKILKKEMPYHPIYFQALNSLDKRMSDIKGRVIADRFTLSQSIYGKLHGIPDEILNELSKNIQQPDLTFVFMGDSFTKDDELYGNENSIIDELYEDFLYVNKNNNKVIRIDVNKPKIETVDEILEYLWYFGK